MSTIMIHGVLPACPETGLGGDPGRPNTDRRRRLWTGGEQAIPAIGTEARIAAGVAAGTTARKEADKAWLSDVYGWRGWVHERLEWIRCSFPGPPVHGVQARVPVS